ncbi:MAG TPA: helical backbone metal receptor [Burkholderiales bacterium]|jgi:ABC-type Fe3+-hydroxamate transport system substrate-binding protein|nr:helical backbone metal receptor [Burkholderiales bacterium]
MARAALVDALGTEHAPAAQARIACLVPSLTELLFALDLGNQVVARTGFCVHPRSAVKAVPKVGGTKDFDLDKLRAAAPTHLLVNVDENPKERVEAAARFIPHVIVTHPLGPLDNPPLYRLVGGIFGRQAQAEALAGHFETAYRDAVQASARLPRERVLYLIWKDPWMTISRETYIARTLAAVGWDQIEVGGADRYPEIPLEDFLGKVDRVLLSSEPYAFTRRDVQRVERLIQHALPATACPSPLTVCRIDAQMTSWYGSRAIEGMRYLKAIRASS